MSRFARRKVVLDSSSEDEDEVTKSGYKGRIDFTQPWEHSDIAFVVEGRKIYGNKMTLSMWSPVMRTMFRADFRERNAREIPLPEKQFDHVLELFRLVHDPEAELTDHCLEGLLSLAREYQMAGLTRRLQTFLTLQPASMKILRFADEYGFADLRRKCLEHAQSHPIHELPMFNDLCPETKLEILHVRCLQYEFCFRRYGSAAGARFLGQLRTGHLYSATWL